MAILVDATLRASFQAAFPGENWLTLTRPADTTETTPDDAILTKALTRACEYIELCCGPSLEATSPTVYTCLLFDLARYWLYWDCKLNPEAAVVRRFKEAQLFCEKQRNNEAIAVGAGAVLIGHGGDCNRQFTNDSLREFTPRRFGHRCC